MKVVLSENTSIKGLLALRKGEKAMKVALVGDGFTDEYIFGTVSRMAPEAPVPVLDVVRRETRPGGVLNVASNLYGLGVIPTVFTITDLGLSLPFPVISPEGCTVLRKTRFVAQQRLLLRADEPKIYSASDLKRMIYPTFAEFDIIAFVDYDKGVVKGGKATIVDSKKKDLGIFKGTEFLKLNSTEWEQAQNKSFPKTFVTRGKDGIDYFEHGEFVTSERSVAKEVLDVTGAGDTVTATIIFCLAVGISDPKMIMRLANKAAGIVIGRFGTSCIQQEELL